MKDFMKKIAVSLIDVVILLFGYLVGRCSVHDNFPGKEGFVTTDTLTLRDTIREVFPMVVDVTISEDDIEVPVTDIVIRNDSLVVLPIEVKTYEGKDYRAQVSGYRPQLDWIEVFPETKYITRETVSRPPPKRWGLGVQLGYGVGVAGGKVHGVPYVGVGISYNILLW